MTDADLVDVVRGLVDIARVAQSPEIFAVDPRVRRANAFLAAQAGSRVPDASRDPVSRDIEIILGDAPVYIGEASPDDPVTIAFARELAFHDLGVVELDWDLVQPLARAQSDLLPPQPSAALDAVVRDWLVSHGLLAPSSEQHQG